ncbi:MAG TPA: hypothetical protein VM328_01050 [Fimbriimonadaceae bacterium]|nr:hypothetical protein [Fimbriimonadaceae bacterium]
MSVYLALLALAGCQSGGAWQPFSPNGAVLGVKLPAAERAALYKACDRLVPVLKQLVPANNGMDLVPQRNLWTTKDLDSRVPSIGMTVRMFTGPLSGEATSLNVVSNSIRYLTGGPIYHGVNNGLTVFRLPAEIPGAKGAKAFEGNFGRAFVLITPTGVEPFKAVSRRRALWCAKRLILQKTQDKHPAQADYYKKMLARVEAEEAAMSEEDLRKPAFIGIGETFTGWDGLLDGEQPHRRRPVPLVEINPALYKPPLKGTQFRTLVVTLPLRSVGNGHEIQHCRRMITEFDWSQFRKLLE